MYNAQGNMGMHYIQHNTVHSNYKFSKEWMKTENIAVISHSHIAGWKRELSCCSKNSKLWLSLLTFYIQKSFRDRTLRINTTPHC